MSEVGRRALGVPDDSRDAFQPLEQAGVLSTELCNAVRARVGFRNIAVHRYHELDLRILRAIVDGHLPDLLAFAHVVERASET